MGSAALANIIARELGILGAGGIGSFYGARLAACGVPTTLIARGDRLRQLRTAGLRVVHDGRSYAPPAAVLDLETLAQTRKPSEFAALLLCTKATATRALARFLAAWFQAAGESCAVVSLQNGVDNERLLADALGAEHVVGGLAVRIGAHVLADGAVEARGPGQLIVGAWPTAPATPAAAAVLQQLAALMGAADVPIAISGDIRRELWRKLVINNGVNPLSAVTGLDTRTLSNRPPYRELVRGLMREAAAAAGADDVQLTERDTDEMYRLISSFDAIKTSMLVDREHGRELELEPICGAVLDRSARLGRDAPYTRTLAALLAGADRR
jgi:2-dehydropantoate 2-reductase